MMSTAAKKTKSRSRSAARVAAVQALYQMDLAGTDLNAVVDEFVRIRFAGEEADDELRDADAVFFAEVLRGVVRRQLDIDPMVDQQLVTGWRLVRVDSIMRAILRAGTFELMERPDVPARVAISEYVEVANAFFTEEEPKVVNGVLDKLARKLRASEFVPKV